MFDSIVTDRLVIRAPVLSDLDALVERRNDPNVAEFQDWRIPYTRDSAQRLLDSAMAMDGPIAGQWWMASVVDRDRVDGPPLGDLAVHLDDQSRTAEIGCTFAAANQGRGYATEAVNALVAYLFDHIKVMRVHAGTHPDNVASAMVLERVGFVFEGRTRLSYSQGQGVDVDYSDDSLYGMTEPDYRQWLARPTTPPAQIELIEITTENWWAVSRLVSHKSQEQLVSPVMVSYGDALFPEVVDGAPFVPWLRAIKADGDLVGFVMVAWRTEHHPNPYLWRLLIDRNHQRRGIGNLALDLVEAECRANGDSAIEVSWSEAKGSPAPFYEARGYVRTGRLVDGETEAIKQL